MTQAPDIGTGVRSMTESLDTMTELYQRLLDLGKRKERCLVQADLADLDAVVRDEQVLVASITQLEAKRLRLQNELARALGCPGDTLTVSRLLEIGPAGEGRLLLSAQERLATVLKDIGEQNELNASLIEQFLSYTDFVLKALKGAGRQTYDPKGQVDDSQSRQPRVFDRKI